MKEMTISLKEYLAKGLRVTEKQPPNTPSLVQAQGCVLVDGALSTLPAWTNLSLGGVSVSFPYPQIFEGSLFTIVCTATVIYELHGTTLVAKLSGLTSGLRWSCVDFGTYMLFTNGKVVVTRDSESGVYAILTAGSVPTGTSMCTVGGQVIVGAYNAVIPYENIDQTGLKIESTSVETELQAIGAWPTVLGEGEVTIEVSND